jgi:tRNA G46 methylase TrmB
MVDGRLAVATDDAEYADSIHTVLGGEPLLENVCAPAPHRSERPDSVPTTFQRDWTAAGRRCVFFEYRRRGSVAGGSRQAAQAKASA